MMSIKLFNILLKCFLLTSIIQKYFINSLLLNEKYPLTKVLSNNNVLLISENSIKIYDSDLSTIIGSHNFNSDEKITSEREGELVFCDEFQDGTSIAFVKKNVFVFSNTGNYLGVVNVNENIPDIPVDYFYNLVAYESNSPNYNFIISFVESMNIVIKYFSFTKNGDNSLSAASLLTSFQGRPKITSTTEGQAKSFGVSCHSINKNSMQVLMCFYEIADPFGISVSYYSITSTAINELDWDKDSTTNNQGSMIKSVLSPDKKKALICYTYYFYDGICVIYDIESNHFSQERRYFASCRGKTTGINVYYFKERNEYMFICNNNQKGFNVVLFNSNFEDYVPNKVEGKSEPYYQFGSNCYYLNNFNVIYMQNVADYILINDCNFGDDKGYKISNINLERLSDPNNNFPSDQPVNLVYEGPKTLVHPNNTYENHDTDAPTYRETDAPTYRETDAPTYRETDAPTYRETDAPTYRETDAPTYRETDAPTYRETDAPTYRETDAPTYRETDTITDIITNIPTQENVVKNRADVIESTESKKNEIINNFDDIIQDKDPDKTYIINGEDFEVIIKPVDEQIEDSSVNIYFSECEKKLKEKYPNKKFRILQINIENKNKNCLTDQVEYKIYDESGQEIELSICSDVEIKIEYVIKNTTLLNLKQISSFKEQGIDVFNIKNDFFNDICYSYSDSASGSDMILSDRVADIYQNYSLCGEECEYESFSVEKLSAECSCKVKQEASYEIEQGNFQSYIFFGFIESNFGVAKCYKLVFSLKGKLNNAGFWIFGTMIFFHIPIYIYYIIKGVNPLLKYLNREMDKKGYSTDKHKNNKGPKKSSRIETTNHSIKETISMGKDNPPKKKINYSYSSNAVIQGITKFKKKEMNKNDNEIDIKFDSPKIKHKNKKIHKSIADDLNQNKKNKKNKLNKNKRSSVKECYNKKDKNSLIDNNIDIEENDYIKYSKKMRKSNKLIINDKNDLNGIETNINTPKIFYKDKDKAKSTKHLKKYHSRKNNLMNEVNSGDFLNQDIKNKFKKKKSKDSEDDKEKNISTISEEAKTENFVRKRKRKLKTEYPLILLNANNAKGEGDDNPFKSNYIISNYDFNEAIQHDKRPFCRILYIYLISKENVLNIILFNPPLELKPIRIAVFIFSFACDFALNALFYLSDNISDKYHYEGEYRELFAVINNLAISIVSALVSFFLLFFFESLTQSSGKIEDLFRTQENLLKRDKNYIVTENTKKLIQNNINRIMRCLKVKIICFFILEFIFMLFFFYYATAFCQVYQSTQISWLLDCLSSYGISLIVTIVFSFIFALLYIISLKYQLQYLYKIITFIYSFS